MRTAAMEENLRFILMAYVRARDCCLGRVSAAETASELSNTNIGMINRTMKYPF